MTLAVRHSYLEQISMRAFQNQEQQKMKPLATENKEKIRTQSSIKDLSEVCIDWPNVFCHRF